MSLLGVPRSSVAYPLSAEAYTTGKSSCPSVAPSLSNRSNVWLTTQSGRAPGRSTLLTTTMGLRPSASAFRVTNRVCGIGPSTASTSSSTLSTMESTRSTSPPKSAWPGVSTMLMWVPSYCTAQFLARMVMPRSRSRSLESMTRSAMCWWAANVPDWRSSLSTSVVFPWSTWAMMAMLRTLRVMDGALEKGRAVYHSARCNSLNFRIMLCLVDSTATAPDDTAGRARQTHKKTDMAVQLPEYPPPEVGL